MVCFKANFLLGTVKYYLLSYRIISEVGRKDGVKRSISDAAVCRCFFLSLCLLTESTEPVRGAYEHIAHRDHQSKGP